MNVKRALSWFFGIVFFDQISKWWMVTHLKSWDLTPFLSFELAFNKGISWSIFDNDVTPWFIYVGIAVVCLALIYQMILRLSDRKSIFAEVTILAGAVGNIIDRFMYGGVVDFIVLHYKEWYFPSFNIADIAITLGVMCMLIQLMYER
jgi:signal peptidase II